MCKKLQAKSKETLENLLLIAQEQFDKRIRLEIHFINVCVFILQDLQSKTNNHALKENEIFSKGFQTTDINKN